MSGINGLHSDNCLNQSLQHLGYPLEFCSDETQWALTDGNKELGPYGMGSRAVAGAAVERRSIHNLRTR